MKDFVQIWNRVTGNQYASNAADRELRDLSHNRLKKSDIDTSTFEANFAECEGLNSKFNDEFDIYEKKDVIINRLFERRRKGHVGRQPKCLFLWLMLGFFALGAGFFILFLHPYDFLFNQKIVLQNGGEIFEMWRKPEVDLYTRIYLFNVTNAEDFMAGKDKTLKVKEVGPYVYKEGLEHIVTGFNDNGTLSAIPRHPLTWVPELSDGNREEDELFLPHIALLSIANVVSTANFMTRFGLNQLITATDTKPLVKMTAREFMMGYESKIMTLGNTFMPGWIYFDKLGLIDRAYDFNGDYETIFTGVPDISKSGLIDTYKGSADLPHWDGKYCSNVQNSSDGTKFQSGLKKGDPVLFYRKSLCRAAPMISTGEGLKSGLKSYLYTFPEHMLDNGRFNEKNKCFCRKGKCLPVGLIDVTDCYYGFPIALSYPHFYQGEEKLFEKVEGLNPNKELHESRFWVQPESGLPLDVSAKFQINMYLEDITNIKNSEKFANMALPLLWFDIRMYELPPNLEQRFKLYLNILPVVEQAAMYISLATGAILVLLTIYILTFKVMFKTLNNKNHHFRSDMWIERETSKKEKGTIYSPCEIPLETESDSDPQFERRPSILKTHSDRLKELSHKLSDKVYDSVGSVKDKVRDELTHVKNIFINDRKNSLIPNDESMTNDAYRSDSGEESEANFNGNYRSIKQSDSDDDYCKYLEVVDDGSEFDDTTLTLESSERSRQLKELDTRQDEIFLNID